jgi:hypothetical protein
MAERKQTPDILSAILTADPELEALPAPPKASPPTAKKAAPAKPKPAASARPAPQPKGPAHWEYRCVSFQQYKGWRARFVDGEEIANWTAGPDLLEHLNRLGAEGWELCAASAGQEMYGASDVRQLFFKRPKS